MLPHCSGWNGGRVEDGRQHAELHHEGRQAVHDHGKCVDLSDTKCRPYF